MGSHTFTWAHAAQEVYVTGTFDNWTKSVKLEKSGNVFQKTVDLPAEKTFYKFVVDGTWTTDHSGNQETDPSGNLNNVLQAHDISSGSSSSAAFISSAAPHSTSAGLAGEQPLEKDRSEAEEELPLETPGDDLPGAFPITPMNDLQQFSVNPIPATEGIGNPIKLSPGEPVPHHSTLTNNTIQSTVRSDPDLQQGNNKEDYESAFGVAPIPATGGIGNPVHLQPGEPVPHPSTLTSNTVDSTVRDGSQYGVSDTGAPVLPPVFGRQEEAEANGAAMFGIPSVGSGGLIPESSLPMGGASKEPSFEPSFTTSSVAPNSTTAQLAGQVPLEPRGVASDVPQVVSESQKAAHFNPEAASSSSAVHDKSAMEDELKQRVPEEPASAESGAVIGVPDVVSDSQHSAHAAPEAAASPEAVREKAAVEEELKQKVPKESSTSDSIIPGAIAGGAAAAGATLIGAALLAKDKATEAYSSTSAPTTASAPSSSSKEVPELVTESQHAAHVSPEASASPVAVSEKAQFENELKHAIPEAPATSESGILGKSEAGLTGKIAAGATAAGAAVAGAAYLAKDKATETYSSTNASASAPSSSSKEVPGVVTESQQAAHVSPEASASPVAVSEKAQFENELKHAIPEAPATSESGILGKSEAGLTGKIAGGATAAGAAVAGAAYLTKDKAADAYTSASGQPPSAIFSEPTVDGSVPSVVTESQEKAHVAPEASANPEAVREKTAFENELQSEVGKAPATSESGALGKSEQGISGKAAAGIAAGTAALGATAAGAAYTARDKAAETTGRDPATILPTSIQSAIDNMNNHVAPLPTTNALGTTSTSTSHVPEAVVESQHEAHVAPEASAEPEAVAEKSQMEKELLSRVPVTNEASEPASTRSAALTETAPVNPTSSDTSFLGASPFDGKSTTPTGVVAVDDVPSVDKPTAVPVSENRALESQAPVSTEAAAAKTGLNAPADSQAQIFATKNEQLAAPTHNEHSRDVSPMTRPESQPQTTTGVDSQTVPATSSASPSTPQKANKRASSFFKSTPESVKTTNSEAASGVDKGSKKKGFLAKLKEKFKS